MTPVKVYTTAWCPFCHRAKALLNQRDIAFEEIDVEGDTETRAWLKKASGQHTVPQVFIGEESIGGFTELAALDRAGGLLPKVGKA